MSTPNNDSTAQFLNYAILIFTGSLIAIVVLGFLNGSINWTGVSMILVFIALMLVYRGRLGKKTK